ncbi:MAG: serine/threonine-protein kinase [Phormidesmis sp. CAN_BIN44]|nr:serine/threonine-protein kinase [Phormidesmis sp. CAN_BIN44]
MSNKIILTITSNNNEVDKRTYEERTTCIIGRSPDCSLQLPNDEAHNIISRYHCLLDINPPAIRVRDLGSRNGTFVNGQLIGQRHPIQTPEEGARMNFPEHDLQAGDKIELGNVVIRVGIEVEEPTKPPSQPLDDLYRILMDLLVRADSGAPNLLAIRGYTILKQLGQGGFGAVYLAHHQQTGTDVALKVMLPKIASDQHAKQMFLREVENTKALQHRNVVKVLDSGCSDDIFFFTLEYCEGGSIADLMRRQREALSIQTAMAIILQVLDGLEYAHNAEIPQVKQADRQFGRGRGLVHRDLKPGNIFLSNTSGSLRARIGDYGLAKAFDLSGLSGLTRSGTLAGTPYFMPRQQVINFKYAQPEVDLWATAATLYSMLTGTYPREFNRGDPYLVVLQTNAVPIRQRNASIPKRLAEVIDLALVDKPKICFQSAAALKQELLAVL